MGRRKKDYETTEYQVKQIRALRRMGWSLHVLAKKFSLSHSTIVYHCRNIPTPEYLTKFIGKKIPPPGPFSVNNQIQCEQYIAKQANNNGKTYAEYLQDETKRRRQEQKIGQARLKALQLSDERRKHKPFISI